MKTFIIENNYFAGESVTPVWSFLPDSALCNTGKPFFIPENSNRIEVFIAPIIRITRLGKSVASRFSLRYYSEAAPALHFRDTEKRKELLAAGLPPDMSTGFDRSMIAGDFIEAWKLIGTESLILYKNGEIAAKWNKDDLSVSIENLFPAISAANTLKMGDYLIPALSEGTEISIGDNLDLKLGDTTLFQVSVK